MPLYVRREYEQLKSAWSEAAHTPGKVVIQKIVLDGKKYSRIEDVPPEEMKRRMEAMLKQKPH